MAEQFLNGPDVVAGLESLGGKEDFGGAGSGAAGGSLAAPLTPPPVRLPLGGRQA